MNLLKYFTGVCSSEAHAAKMPWLRLNSRSRFLKWCLAYVLKLQLFNLRKNSEKHFVCARRRPLEIGLKTNIWCWGKMKGDHRQSVLNLSYTLTTWKVLPSQESNTRLSSKPFPVTANVSDKFLVEFTQRIALTGGSSCFCSKLCCLCTCLYIRKNIEIFVTFT